MANKGRSSLFVGIMWGIWVSASVLSGQPTGQNERIVPGRILVQFRPEVSESQARGVLTAAQARSLGELPRIGVHVVALPAGASEKAYARAFRERPDVAFAEVDALVPLAGTAPNDPGYSMQWHLSKIEAPAAWSTTTGTSGITIAILDTGVDGSHEDLQSKMVAGWNFYDNNSDSRDVHGHGTKVAGAAAAATNNGLGVASVAWGCWIMPIRVSAPDGYAAYSAIASGITWAADRGARVANVSYMVSTSSTVTSAARYMQTKGGVVTVSAGNQGVFDAAADNPYVLTVSGTDANDALYSWSNTGNNVDLAAPGCVSATTAKGGTYVSACGTSFSAPIVAGVAALVLSAKPSLDGVEAMRILQQSADDRGAAGWDSGYGWGRVNAARAVVLASGSAPAPAPTPTPTADTTAPSIRITSPAGGGKVSGNVSVLVEAADNVAVVKVELYVDGKLIETVTAAPFTTKWNTRRDAAGAHTLVTKAYDAAGNVGTSAAVTVYK